MTRKAASPVSNELILSLAAVPVFGPYYGIGFLLTSGGYRRTLSSAGSNKVGSAFNRGGVARRPVLFILNLRI